MPRSGAAGDFFVQAWPESVRSALFSKRGLHRRISRQPALRPVEALYEALPGIGTTQPRNGHVGQAAATWYPTVSFLCDAPKWERLQKQLGEMQDLIARAGLAAGRFMIRKHDAREFPVLSVYTNRSDDRC